jgi:hypothetical protein
MDRAYACMGEKRSVYRFLMGEPVGNRLLGKSS